MAKPSKNAVVSGKRYLLYATLGFCLVLSFSVSGWGDQTDEQIKVDASADESLKGTDSQFVLPDPRGEALEGYDWDTHFKSGGELSDQLQLSLAAPDKPYRYGPPYYLYFGLKNHSADARTVEAMSACGSLSRSDAMVFRIRSDDGSELIVPNRYEHTAAAHMHQPLHVEGSGVAVDLVDFNGQVSTSGELFDLIKVSKSVTITAEFPAISLRSNSVTFEVMR
jgi:hypothetical protein